MSRNPRVSFIIPVRNDAARLRTCLRSILRNPQAPSQVEIVVVDNASTDESAAVAENFGARVFRVEGGRVAELRNYGAERAGGDVLAFVDADHEIAAGWVYSALDCLQNRSIGVVGALCHAPTDGTWVQRLYGHLRGIADESHDVAWLGSGNMAVRRTAFEAVGGFDTSLETCEDVDLCHRIRAYGLRIVSDARLQNIHYGDPRTLGEVFRSERWRGRDNLRVSFRRPITWAFVPSALLPVGHVVMLAVLLLGIAVAPFIRPAGLILAAGAAVAFVAATALRVLRAQVKARRLRVTTMAQAFAVACAYDFGRALALVTKAPHRSAPRRSVAGVS